MIKFTDRSPLIVLTFLLVKPLFSLGTCGTADEPSQDPFELPPAIRKSASALTLASEPMSPRGHRERSFELRPDPLVIEETRVIFDDHFGIHETNLGALTEEAQLNPTIEHTFFWAARRTPGISLLPALYYIYHETRDPRTVHFVDAAGRTPLFYASLPTTIFDLVRYGIDPNQRDLSGNTALIQFILFYRNWHQFEPTEVAQATTRSLNLHRLRSIIDALLENADPNLADADGNTALHLNEDPEIAIALIHAGADPLQPNRAGDTPIERARGAFNIQLAIVMTPMPEAAVEPPFQLLPAPPAPLGAAMAQAPLK